MLLHPDRPNSKRSSGWAGKQRSNFIKLAELCLSNQGRLFWEHLPSQVVQELLGVRDGVAGLSEKRRLVAARLPDE